jgi:DNA-binding MarR family transcriptional regulator
MIPSGFDPVIQAPLRLQLCAFLAPMEEAELKVLREALGVSDSVLSKHLGQLGEAGYVALAGRKVDGRQRKWARLTGEGRRALAAHLEALQAIARQAQGA